MSHLISTIRSLRKANPSQRQRLGITAASAVLLLALCTALVLATGGVAPRTARAAALTGLHVQGNKILDGTGATVQLRGVNRSGTEYACIQGWGIFDGPSDDASVAAIASWGANIVRVPLNEDCWLGINGVNPAYAGQNYINAIVAYVNLLHAHGMYAELSLIWGAPGTYQATYQSGSPDEDHSPAMWASMGATFKNDPNVVLAPWGETIVDWGCFQYGGTCEATYGPSNTPYDTAGMNQAVVSMRGAGYHGIIAIPCVDYANDCNDNAPEWGGQNGGGDWLSHEPLDQYSQLIGEAHIYGKNVCSTTTCLNDTIAPELAGTGGNPGVPFIFGETGETYDGSDCNNSSAHTSTFLNWADAHGVGYEVWAWDTWGACNLSLITDYSGTPDGVYGTYVRGHLLSLAGSGGGTPAPSPTATATATLTPSPTATATATATATPTNTPTPPPTPTSTPTNTPTPSPTPTPPPPPPPNGHLALVQAHTNFIDYSGVNESYSSFTSPVTSGDLLVAIVSIGGGNQMWVSRVEDDLGNTWHLATANVNGDETDVEVWYTVTAIAGADEVDAYLVFGPEATSQFAQTLMTVAEFHGAGALIAAGGKGSTARAHASPSVFAVPGDLIVGAYADAGYQTRISITDGKTQLGTRQDVVDAINGDQSYGYATGNAARVAYATSRSVEGEVSVAVFG